MSCAPKHLKAHSSLDCLLVIRVEVAAIRLYPQLLQSTPSHPCLPEARISSATRGLETNLG